MATLTHHHAQAQVSASPVRQFAQQARSVVLRLGLLGALAVLPVASVPLTASAAVAPLATHSAIAGGGPSSPCSGVSLPC